MNDIGKAALDAFQRLARPILPIQPGAKFPPRFKWKRVDNDDHTTYAGLDTANGITGWWEQHPDDNYAILTGGDLVVVDVDVKGSDDGFDALDDLGWNKPTFRVATPSGGRHDYYATGGHIVRTFAGFKPGLDIKGNGGYVIGPGSVLHRGTDPGEYTIVMDDDVAPAYELLVDNDWLSACTSQTLLMAASRNRAGGVAAGVADEWAAVWRVLRTDHLKQGRSLGPNPDLPNFGQGQRHRALLECFGWMRNQIGWRSFERWCRACEWVSDAITTPSLRLTSLKEFDDLVRDVWVKEEEPKPFDLFEHRDSRNEAMLDSNPLFNVLQYAPEYATEDEIDWVIDGLVPKRSITAVAALFKTGKSELVSAMVGAITSGKRFLDRETKKSKVLYLTEERQGTFQIKADRYSFGYEVGIVHRSRLLAEQPLSWEESIDKARELCAAQGYDVLIIDTFTRWSGLHDENSNAEITKKMTPLEKVAGAGVAVVIVHQHGKSTERHHGLSMRGASAFGDAVDVFIEMYRPKVSHNPQQRMMTVMGRINEFRFTVQFDPNLGYFLVSDDTDKPLPSAGSAKENRREDLRFMLDLNGEISANTVVADGGMGWTQQTASRHLNEMVAEGELTKEKRGKEVWYRRP
jgi:hypothetical protein